MSLWWHVAYAYLAVAAFFLGKFETEDFYRGRNGTPRGVATNLLFAIGFPVAVVISLL